MNMKRISQKAAALLLMVVASLGSMAQQKTTLGVLYPEYKPATITLTDGRVVKNPLSNVFLKNSTLIYLHGTITMEAKMSTIYRVEFEDRSFVNINDQLASVVGTVGNNVLFRIDYLDIDAYNANLKNNVQISNISLGDQIGTSTVDLNNEEDYKFPLIHKYYMRYNGQIIYVHEREILRHLPKEKKRMFKTIVGMPEFNWVEDESVMMLLKAISD